MDEIKKIHVKSSALIRARDYLLNQNPSDMVAVTHITESIVDLTRRHLATADALEIPQVTTREQRRLQLAIRALDENMEKNAPATQILIDANAVFGLKPWPPEAVYGLKPWPPKASSRGRVFATRPDLAKR